VTWNYRLVRREMGEDTIVSIREVYYDGDGAITGWTQKPVEMWATEEEGGAAALEWMLDRFRAALDQPVIDEAEELARIANANREASE
jgi:hypothetical protein